MEKESFNGEMDQNIKEILIIISFKERVNTHGQMEENILGNGKIIKWMDKEYQFIYEDFYLDRWKNIPR